jgi:hydroxypyruvate reductase
MTQAVWSLLGERIDSGLVIVKEGYSNSENTVGTVRIIEGAHPLPDYRGVKATEDILYLLDQAGENDLIICLISGGGSALMTAPLNGITFEMLSELTSTLLARGADIKELNTLRKRLDQVKGGGLALRAYPSQVLTLILSDVVGDCLDMIASGPTVPDSSTVRDALSVVERYNIAHCIPDSVYKTWQHQVGCEEAGKQQLDLFTHVENIVVGNNERAAKAALVQAEKEGLRTQLLTTTQVGEARLVGSQLGGKLRKLAQTGEPVEPPVCLLVGGETTVSVQGSGLGGRNQELALGAVEALAGFENVALITLATDGGDGPTDAAGAVVTGETLRCAQELGMSPKDYLDNNDAYHFFLRLGDLLKPGPTKTNVNDLIFLFCFGESG